MVASHNLSRRTSASGRNPRGWRPVLDGVVLLLGVTALVVVLLVALVWTLWTLGLVLV